MKSRVLVAVRYPSDALGETHLGVLVIESLDGSWDIAGTRARLDGSDWWTTLQRHLLAQRNRIPVLSDAHEAGF